MTLTPQQEEEIKVLLELRRLALEDNKVFVALGYKQMEPEEFVNMAFRVFHELKHPPLQAREDVFIILPTYIHNIDQCLQAHGVNTSELKQLPPRSDDHSDLIPGNTIH